MLNLVWIFRRYTVPVQNKNAILPSDQRGNGILVALSSQREKEREREGEKRESSLYINIFNALYTCALRSARARAISRRLVPIYRHAHIHTYRRVRGTMHSTESLTRV